MIIIIMIIIIMRKITFLITGLTTPRAGEFLHQDTKQKT